MKRRHLILLLLPALVIPLTGITGSSPLWAKDGDGGGDGGNSGGGGGDGGGHGGDAGGRGGGDSGRGGGDGGRGGDNSGRGGDDRGRDDGGGRGRGRGADDGPRAGGWGSTSPEQAQDAVSHGWALSLSSVLPTVARAVPGQVLEVDLRQGSGGEWRYEILVLTRDRRYQEVVVDARRNHILQIRRR